MVIVFDGSELEKEEIKIPVVMKVVGVGGGGCNAINRMMEIGLWGVELIAANTDRQSLSVIRAHRKIELASDVTKGQGVGGNPSKGKAAAETSSESIKKALEGADMVFLTAGMGGGTGTGALPVFAKIAKEVGALTFALVTKPFAFEGEKRLHCAIEGIKELKGVVDAYTIIDNEHLFRFVDPGISVREAFKKVDEVLTTAVKGISDIIAHIGVMNLDFADIRTILEGMGLTFIGYGEAREDEEDKAVKAAQAAISSSILEHGSIDGATKVLYNIWTGEEMNIGEFKKVGDIIKSMVSKDAYIISGIVLDKNFTNEVRVNVIATGFENSVQYDIAQSGKNEHQIDVRVDETDVPLGVIRREVNDFLNNQDSGEIPNIIIESELANEMIEYIHFPQSEEPNIIVEHDTSDTPSFFKKQVD